MEDAKRSEEMNDLRHFDDHFLTFVLLSLLVQLTLDLWDCDCHVNLLRG